MDKNDFSRKENLWLFVMVIGVLCLGNISVRYPIVAVVEVSLLIILTGYCFFRMIQTFKASQGHDASTVERFQKLLDDPKIVEALEASMRQSTKSEDDKPHDEPRLIQALKKVRNQDKK